MTPGWYVLYFLVGLLVTLFCASGARVLRRFPRHDFEEYCRQKRREGLFEKTMKHHVQWALAAEAGQMLGTSLSIGGLSLLVLGTSGEDVGPNSLVLILVSASFALLVFASWVPWVIAQLAPVPFLANTWQIWEWSARVVKPLSVGLSMVGTLLSRATGKEEEVDDEEEAFDDEIRAIVSSGEHEGLLEADARDMIEGVIELDDMAVGQIMTPRSRIQAIEVDSSWDELIAFVIEVGRTRLPVYEKTLENIVGVLFVKDLLPKLSQESSEPNRSLRELLREPWFVPQSKVVHDMLQDFLQNRNHLAIVLDEYESVSGVVTIEDILEEIVGEIVDETDREVDEDIVRINESEAEVTGQTPVDRLNQVLALGLPENQDYGTIAGLVLSQLREIPKPGVELVWENLTIQVLQANRRRIERLRIKRNDVISAEKTRE